MPSVFARRLDLTRSPPNLPKAAEVFFNDIKDEIVMGPPPRNLVVYSIGPTRPLRWELVEPPSPPDDLVRAIIQHEQAFVAALVHPAPVPPGLEADRVWMISCEDATRRMDLMLALRGTNDRGGAAQFQVLQSDIQEHSPRWIGVPPDDVSVFELDDVDGAFMAGGPVGEA